MGCTVRWIAEAVCLKPARRLVAVATGVQVDVLEARGSCRQLPSAAPIVASCRSLSGHETVRLRLAEDFQAGSSSSSALACEGVPGSVEDYYGFHEVLGSGAMGTVRRATCQSTGETFAVKVMETTKLDMQMEMELLARLSHRNIIRFVEGFEASKTTYLFMEMCRGGEVYGRFQELSRFVERDAAILMQQMLSAVAYMHSQFVCHRDLKLENCMLATDDAIGRCTVKLADFGLACVFTPGKFMTETVGTPMYMAPEVLRKRYTEKCDAWSLGCILYVMLKGSSPYKSGSQQDVLQQAAKGAVRKPAGAKWERISQEGTRFLEHLLQGEADRYSAEQAKRDSWIKRYASPSPSPSPRTSFSQASPTQDDIVEFTVDVPAKKGDSQKESKRCQAWAEDSSVIGSRKPAPQAKLLLGSVRRDEDMGIKAHRAKFVDCVVNPKQSEASLRAAGLGPPARHAAPRVPDADISGWPLELPGCVQEHATIGDGGKYSHGSSAYRRKRSESPFRQDLEHEVSDFVAWSAQRLHSVHLLGLAPLSVCEV